MAGAGTFTLGDLTLELYDEEPSLGSPVQEFGTVSGPLSREPADTLRFVSEWREQTWPVRLKGVASLSENARECAVRLQHNLSVELAKGANTLVVTRRGSDVENTWRVHRSQVPAVPFTRIFDKGGIAYVPVTLKVSPWVEAAPVTQILCSSLPTPDVVDFSVAGSRPAELELTITRAFTGGGLQTFLAALIPPEFELEDLLFLAKGSESPNWGKYTATAGYESGDDNVQRCIWTSYKAMTWPDSRALPVGRYGLFSKCRIQSGGKGWLAQSRSGDEQSSSSVVVKDNDWDFVFIGDWASDGCTPPRIVGKSREADNGIILDWILAVPLGLGSPFYFHCTSLSVDSLSISWLDTVLETTSGDSRSARRWVRGSGLEGVGDLRMLIAAANSNGDGRRPKVSIGETHTPLYDHWVPNTEDS
jgi:hypothetical protein